MKTLECDLCETTAEGETFEAWMRALMPHYMQVHGDVMKGKANLTAEEKKDEQMMWMVDNKARFNAA